MALPAAAAARRGPLGHLGRDRRARLLDDAGHERPPALPERPDALRGPAPAGAGSEPDRPLRARGRGARALGRAADRAPRGGGGERADRPRQRARGRDQQGLAPGGGVRRHRARPTRTEHGLADGDQVVRRQLRRGPGPVVARRDHPARLPVRDGAGSPCRRARHRHARGGPRERGAGGPGRGRLRGPQARSGLDGGGTPRRSDGAAHRAGARHRAPRGPTPQPAPPCARGPRDLLGPAHRGGAHRSLAAALRGAGARVRGPGDAEGGHRGGPALVVRAAGPLPARRDAPVAKRPCCRVVHPPGRLPAGRDRGARPAHQPEAGLHPGRQPSRLRPEHRAGDLRGVDARRPGDHEAIRLQRRADLALSQ